MHNDRIVREGHHVYEKATAPGTRRQCRSCRNARKIEPAKIRAHCPAVTSVHRRCPNSRAHAWVRRDFRAREIRRMRSRVGALHARSERMPCLPMAGRARRDPSAVLTVIASSTICGNDSPVPIPTPGSKGPPYSCALVYRRRPRARGKGIGRRRHAYQRGGSEAGVHSPRVTDRLR